MRVKVDEAGLERATRHLRWMVSAIKEKIRFTKALWGNDWIETSEEGKRAQQWRKRRERQERGLKRDKGDNRED